MSTLTGRYKTAFEVAGLMVQPASKNSSRHTLLRPVNPRLGNAREAHPWLPEEHLYLDGDPDEDHEAYLYWDALAEEEVEPTETWQALWEVLKLWDANPKEILDFTLRWGVLAGHWDGEGYGDRFGARQEAVDVGQWQAFADFTNTLVTLLALTAQGELIDEGFLRAIQSWDDLPDLREYELPANPSQEDYDEWFRRLDAAGVGEALDKRNLLRKERRWQSLLEERRQGRGLQQQRRLVSRKLSSLMGMQYVLFDWDENGRVMQTMPTGLDEIIFSHIATIFLSADVDILVCSVCGTPFMFDDATHGRRPRFGVRRFCSDVCRREGKRESNRQSWRRNSARWRRNSTGKQPRGGDE